MLNLFLRRVLVAIPTILLISVFVFALQKLLPGDPVLAMAGEERDPVALAAIREQLGLNDPLPVQYFRWLAGALQGDLGTSLRTGQPVTQLIVQKLPVTLQLGVMALLIALVIGIPAGIISAVRKGTVTDYAANMVALSGMSIPNFWLGIMLIVLFSGYENFVSKLNLTETRDRPDWMGTVDFAGLKLKLVASIVAISGIHLLKSFMEIGEAGSETAFDPLHLRWMVIIHLTFVISGVLLALMDWINARGGAH